MASRIPLVCSLALTCVIAAPAACEEPKSATEIRKLLTNLADAEPFELLSIDPASKDREADEVFHGYKILGRTAIEDAAVRRRLMTAFVKGMEGDFLAPDCFVPRHGVRAVLDEDTVDLVICFECSRFHLHDGDARPQHRLVRGRDAEPLFDEVLRKAGIPKAP